MNKFNVLDNGLIVNKISKTFEKKTIVRDISLNIQKGEIVAHICHGSRKDFRNAVEVAHKAFDSWSSMTGYLRGQILYRMAEMLEGRREEFAAAIQVTQPLSIAAARAEVDASVDRLVRFAGWTDKYQQVIGCANPVAGNYYNFTVPQPQGTIDLAPAAYSTYLSQPSSTCDLRYCRSISRYQTVRFVYFVRKLKIGDEEEEGSDDIALNCIAV